MLILVHMLCKRSYLYLQPRVGARSCNRIRFSLHYAGQVGWSVRGGSHVSLQHHTIQHTAGVHIEYAYKSVFISGWTFLYACKCHHSDSCKCRHPSNSLLYSCQCHHSNSLLPRQENLAVAARKKLGFAPVTTTADATFPSPHRIW